VDGLLTPLHVTVVVAQVVLRWVMEEVSVGAAEAESAPTAAARRDREARAIFATLCVFVAGALEGIGRKARDLIANKKKKKIARDKLISRDCATASTRPATMR
jgi:hypothetical protein